MASRPKNDDEAPKTRRPPARTPEGRENQLINMAIEEAERQIEGGTASAQVLTHFLKMGTEREKLERRRIELENELTVAKVEALASAQRMEELYAEAINAMRIYSGQDPVEVEAEYDD